MQNHLTHPDSDWGSLRHDRDAIISHLSTHPEHAWRYPAGYDFGSPMGEGTTGLDWAAAHRRHHQATPAEDERDRRGYDPAGLPRPQTAPRVSDAAYRDITGQHLDFTQPGPWTLTGWDHDAAMDITTTHEGPLDGSAPAQLAAAYPGVRVWRACPARIDETYRDHGRACGRLMALLGIDMHDANAVLAIAASENLGFRFAYGRFEVTGDDDEQSWRIRTTEPQPQPRARQPQGFGYDQAADPDPHAGCDHDAGPCTAGTWDYEDDLDDDEDDEDYSEEDADQRYADSLYPRFPEDTPLALEG